MSQTKIMIHRLSDWKRGQTASDDTFRCCQVPGEQEAPAGGWTFLAGEIGAEPADQKILVEGTGAGSVDEDDDVKERAARLLGLMPSDPAPAERIAGAKSLEDLCVALNDLCEALGPDGDYAAAGVDITALPLFGGDVPTSTNGVYSWDATGLLISDGGPGFCRRTHEPRSAQRPWTIVDRADYEAT